MSENPWYKFFVGDYRAKTGRLTMAQHGAYRLLLDDYYATREPLPKSEELCHAICHAASKQDRDDVGFVLRKFFQLDEDGWHHNRADKELNKSSKLKDVRSEAGKKGANQRWQHDGKADSKPVWQNDGSPEARIELEEGTSELNLDSTNESGSSPTTPNENNPERGAGGNQTPQPAKLTPLPKAARTKGARSGDKPAGKKTPSNPTIKELLNGLSDDFENLFWPNYPRKTDKRAAATAYKRAIGRGATIEKILHGLKFYVDEIRRRGTEPEFIKHAERWLNADGWDIPEPPKPEDLIAKLVARSKELVAPKTDVMEIERDRMVKNLLKCFRNNPESALRTMESVVNRSDDKPLYAVNEWLRRHGPPGLNVGPVGQQN